MARPESQSRKPTKHQKTADLGSRLDKNLRAYVVAASAAGVGLLPLGGLILDKKGNLYGTAYSVVFEITP